MEKTTKTEFISNLAKKLNTSKTQASDIYEGFIETIIDELKENKKIALIGFGTFEVKNQEEKVGRNPSTGESMTIPAKVVPKFKFSTSVKDSLN